MPVLNDYYCKVCGFERCDEWSDDPPSCCGSDMSVALWVNHFEWEGPRTYSHLRDEAFSSRSELKSWTEKRGLTLSASAEKVGGARNDMYDGIGKTYSIPGVSRRDNPLAGLPRGK